MHCGFIEIPSSHVSPFAIDESVLLYEPALDDIVGENEHSRVIFNNVAITQEEGEHVEKFLEYLLEKSPIAEKSSKDETSEIIYLMQSEFLRFLYSAKFDYKEAASLTLENYRFRLSDLLPATTDGIEDELRNGYLYWFGRDKKFRPTLIADIFKLQDIPVEKILKLVVFCFEFFLRYLHVGGRAENYNVIIDCCNKGVVEVPIQMIIKLTEVMHSKYRGRLNKIYLINTPGLINVIMKTLSNVLPKSTFEKMVILKKDFKDVLLTLYNPNQLQNKFGGSSSDLTENFYPFNFFPNADCEEKLKLSPELILDLPPHVLYGVCMPLKKHRITLKRHRFFEDGNCTNAEEATVPNYDLESWTTELGSYMLTKNTAKYILNNKPQLKETVERNIIETKENLELFLRKMKTDQ